MRQSKRRRTQTARNAPTIDPARTNSVARQERLSEKMMGRERCKDKGTSRTVHTEFQKPGAHLQASVFAPEERLTARSAPKNGPGRETLDQENIITGDVSGKYFSRKTYIDMIDMY